jgi:hypothetical protein
MLDRDLADLYDMETRVLNQAVQRNIKKFPNDFMFALTREEIRNISQIVISSKIKHAPNVLAFTEQGVDMLSGILNSDRAIEVNITIMRVFVRLRQMMVTQSALAGKLVDLEERIQDHDEQITDIFKAIRQLMTPPMKPKRKITRFSPDRRSRFDLKEKQARYGKKSRLGK